jgi:hypothetical protein
VTHTRHENPLAESPGRTIFGEGVPRMRPPARPPDQRFRRSRHALTICNSRIRSLRISDILYLLAGAAGGGHSAAPTAQRDCPITQTSFERNRLRFHRKAVRFSRTGWAAPRRPLCVGVTSWQAWARRFSYGRWSAPADWRKDPLRRIALPFSWRTSRLLDAGTADFWHQACGL